MQRSNRRAPALMIAVLALAIAGCGGSKGGGRTSTADGMTDGPLKQPPAATKNIALLRWNLAGGEPSTLDAARIFAGSDILVDANLCESLLYLTPKGDVTPALATAIDRPDDRTYVVHLRPGVTFSDGSRMTAADVVYSLDRVRDPDFGSYWGYFAQRVKSVKATDARTVTITLSQPDAIFYKMLATPMAQVLAKAYVEKEGKNYGTPGGGVMCTGPYKLAKWSKGTSITLVANERWWNRRARAQRAAEVRFTFLTDDATVTSALSSGDIDGSYDLPRAAITKFGSSVFMGVSTKQQVLIPTRLGDRSSPLSNPQLREALAKSIDYAGILKTFIGRSGEPLRAIMPPGSWGTAEDIYRAAYEKLPAPAQDLAGAKKLVAASGVAKPSITVAVPGDIPEYRAIGETLQSNARQAGFDVTLRPLPMADFSALFSDPEARAKVDAFFCDYYADIPDPLELYMQIGVPRAAADFGGYKNARVAKLIDEARLMSDDRQRAALTVKVQAQITADRVWIPISYPYQTLYLKDGIAGASVAFPTVMYWPWLPDVGGR